MISPNPNTKITIVVIFYNNRREAERTLYTMSTAYQYGVTTDDYEVIAIDSNSSEPLEEEMVKSFGPNFSYHYYKTNFPSPCAALNWGITQANTPYVMPVIDGAHMLSPRVIHETKTVLSLHENACVYTVPFHLGPLLQNESMLDGYNQTVEDNLLNSIPWKEDGHQLFSISEIENANHSFFSKVVESNCFTINRKFLLEIGGFNEAFNSRGGGMVNLDVFKQIVENENIQPVALVGEASFHQFHGGVSTNVKRVVHPIDEYKKEYHSITGKRYEPPIFKPFFWGHFPDELIEYMPDSSYQDTLRVARRLANMRKSQSAIDVLEIIREINVYNPNFYGCMGLAHFNVGNLEEAKKYYERSVELSPYLIESNLKLADIYAKQGEGNKSLAILEKISKVEINEPRIYVQMALSHLEIGNTIEATVYVEEAFGLIKNEPHPLVRTYIDLAKIFEKTDKLNQAIAVFKLGLEHHENFPVFYLHLGRLFVLKEEFIAAEAYFFRAIYFFKENPQNLYIAFANFYTKQKKLKTALQILNEAKTFDPQNERLLSVIQRVETAMEKQRKPNVLTKEIRKENISKLESLAKNFPTDVHLLTELAKNYWEIQLKGKAMIAANNAHSNLTDSKGTLSKIYLDLAQVFHQLSAATKAIDVLKLGLQHHPQQSAFYLQLGEIFKEQKKFTEAETAFAHALEYYEGDPEEIHVLLADS